MKGFGNGQKIYRIFNKSISENINFLYCPYFYTACSQILVNPERASGGQPVSAVGRRVQRNALSHFVFTMFHFLGTDENLF